MNGTLVIARRELSAFFRVPLGWVVMALFLFLSGFVFVRFTLQPGTPATMRDFFSFWWRVLVVVSPAVSMRLLAEEHRTGTIDPLMSSPVSELAVVTGKFLGAVGFLAACLAPTLVYAVVLLLLARPDPGPIAAGYLGILLLGSFQIALGLLFSSLTASQTLAFLATLITLIVLEFGATYGAGALPAPWDQLPLAFSTDLRIADFAKGVIDTRHVVFFTVASAWLCGLAAVVLRTRRWR
ncbi:MAG TPA: ABC transporter permease [Phycisphaerales bacterium]|nr:ABC transporter permease [Phycisphaerales bacterium]